SPWMRPAPPIRRTCRLRWYMRPSRSCRWCRITTHTLSPTSRTRGNKAMFNNTKKYVAVLALLCAATAQAAVTDSDLKAVEGDLSALGKRITRLQDMTEVEIVQHAYGYYVDKAQWRSVSE